MDNCLRVEFNGTIITLVLCFCVLLVALPRSPVIREIVHHMYGGTGPCPGCRCVCVPASATATAPSSSNNDDEDEDKEDEGNDEEGGRKDKCNQGFGQVAFK